MNSFIIAEKTEYKLCFVSRKNNFFLFLFWICLVVFGIYIRYSIPFIEAYYYKLNNIYNFTLFFMFYLLLTYLFYKLLMNLRFFSFTIKYIFEKVAPRKFIYYYKILGISSSAKVFPDYHYLVSQQLSFLGKYGFYLYVFNIKAKEILNWNLFFRLAYDLFHPPYIRLHNCYSSEYESKDKALYTIREIESFLDGDSSLKSGSRTNLMRITVTSEDVKDYVNKGGDLNARDTILGNTALFYACGTDPELPISKWVEPNFEVIGEMIKLGLDVNACNYKNERVIDYIRKVTSNVSGEPPSLGRLKSYLESNGYKK